MITKDDVWSFLTKVGRDPVVGNFSNPRDAEDYNLCLYHDGVDSYCLIGYWFKTEIMVDDMFFSYIEGKAADSAVQQAIDLGIIDANDIDDEAIALLTSAQEYADRYSEQNEASFTWAEAIDELFYSY